MTSNAADFLKEWMLSYIYAESRSLDELNDTVEECIRDAGEAGINKEQLEAAAEGDLAGVIGAAIKRASGE